jgi:ribonuclease HI
MQHCREAMDNMKALLLTVSDHVALLQEPHVFRNRVIGMQGAGVVFRPTQENPRVCIVASKTCNGIMLSQLCTRDVVAIKVPRKGKAKEAVFASVYLPHPPRGGDPEGYMPPSDGLRDLVSYCQDNNHPLIVGMDCNAHHTVWGSTDTNQRGSALLDYILQTDLDIMNVGDKPTFVNKRRREVLDITLVSLALAGGVANWEVRGEDSFSDHRLIRFTVSLECARGPTVLRRLPKKTDWGKYSTVLDDKLCTTLETEVCTVDDLERFSESLSKAVSDAIRASCPVARIRDKGGIPGWTPELSRLKSQCRKLNKKAVSTGNPDDWRLYRVARNEFKEATRKAKRDAWRAFCGETESMSALTRLQKILRGKTGSDLSCSTLLKADGTYTDSSKETLDVYMDTFFPRLEDEIPVVPPVEHDAMPFNEDMVSLDKVRCALASFDPFKSPGPDEISPAHLQRGGERLLGAIRTLYVSSLRLGYIPKGWRAARVVFLSKPGRADIFNPKAKRPICLTSFLLKGLERLVDWHIRATTLVEHPLSNRQFAYTAGVSTETALHCLVNLIEKALENGEFALCIFLDCEGAFDRTPHISIAKGLDRVQVLPVLKRWIMSMLANREVTATLLDAIRTMKVVRGTPQGGVLSPLLWNIVVDDLLVLIRRLLAWSQGYADDISLLQVGKHCSTVGGTMQVALNFVARWCADNYLRLNPDKTVMVMFTLKRKWTLPPLALCGKQLVLAQQAKYLGVILDHKLTWAAHVKYTTEKALRILAASRRAVGKRWGLTPEAMRWIHTSIVLPIMTYGSVVWARAADTESNLSRLRHVQRTACLGISGAMKSAPTQALEALTGFLPVDLKVREEALCSFARLRSSNQWRGWQFKARPLVRQSHMEWTQRQARLIPELEFPSDSIPPRLLLDRRFKVVRESREVWQERNLPLAPLTGYACYTDGSRHDNFTGAGALIIPSSPAVGDRTEKRSNLGRYGTVFQAEVTGVTEAAEELLARGVERENITIYCDSTACLGALTNPRVRSHTVLRCADGLNRLGDLNSLELHWVPGHMGVQGNEEVDLIAKSAAVQPVEAEPRIPVSKAVTRAAIKQHLRSIQERRWTNMTSCRLFKSWFPSLPTATRVAEFYALPRSKIWQVTALLTGHVSLNHHLHRIGVAETALCDRCQGVEETPLHILGECPCYGAARLFVFNELYMDLDSLRKAKFSKLAGFVEHTRCFRGKGNPARQGN